MSWANLEEMEVVMVVVVVVVVVVRQIGSGGTGQVLLHKVSHRTSKACS